MFYLWTQKQDKVLRLHDLNKYDGNTEQSPAQTKQLFCLPVRQAGYDSAVITHHTHNSQ